MGWIGRAGRIDQGAIELGGNAQRSDDDENTRPPFPFTSINVNANFASKRHCDRLRLQWRYQRQCKQALARPHVTRRRANRC